MVVGKGLMCGGGEGVNVCGGGRVNVCDGGGKGVNVHTVTSEAGVNVCVCGLLLTSFPLLNIVLFMSLP